jgi:hypothetical protein
MFLKKFKIFKLEPMYTSRGSTILYTKSLIVITLRETSHRVTNKRAAKVNVKQAPSFTTDFCPSNERETRKKKKILSLGFREASDTFRV